MTNALAHLPAAMIVAACEAAAAGLHPDTAPGAIRAAQRAAVRAAWAELRAAGRQATARRISEATDLPVGIVGKRLAELRRERKNARRRKA